MSLAANRVVVSFDAVVKAWADTRSHPMWIVGNAILIVISLVFMYLSRSSLQLPPESLIWYGGLLGLTSWIINALLSATYQREYLGFLRGEKPKLKGIFNTAMFEWKFIALGAILYVPEFAAWITRSSLLKGDPGLMLILSMISALVSLICLCLFSFSGLILIDQGVGPINALTGSLRFIVKAPFAIIWMLILAWFTSILGVVACGIGYLMTAPIYLLAKTIIYEENRKAGLFDNPLKPAVQ